MIWQLNIDSWQRRGWQLLREAEKAEVGGKKLEEQKGLKRKREKRFQEGKKG